MNGIGPVNRQHLNSGIEHLVLCAYQDPESRQRQILNANLSSEQRSSGIRGLTEYPQGDYAKFIGIVV